MKYSKSVHTDFPTNEGTLKLHVFKSTSPPATVSTKAALPPRPNAVGGMVHGGHDDSAEQTTAEGAKVDRFDTQVTQREVLEILRDISLYISSRELQPINQWVSSSKSLITPATARVLPPSKTQRFSRITRTSTPSSRPSSAKTLLKSASQSSADSSMEDVWTSWTSGDVANWLRNVGFEDVVGSFEEHDITGKGLIALSNDTLKDLGITSTTKRIKLLSAIEELKACSPSFFSPSPTEFDGVGSKMAGMGLDEREPPVTGHGMVAAGAV
ncbi:hypothetical protein HK097_010019 [Rhizophlyctis rosea]|uniref:SAM domain-containing protein n=1 Tax=Rhizophlyctis rosea TaxID=64517 RepID=A0AAD5X550_9FUNG|nr:hypothetical protein HK097_010019 [Rhizophlyctis rosea]